ncbi:MAG: hypothetical protein ACK5YI_10955 [Rhodospirillales bacterium]|jgi:hypothetical protein
MLFRVVRGSSSTSLNLAGRKTPPGLFNNNLLDRSIVFKFPKFEVEADPGRSDRTVPALTSARPIETGVFIPDDPANPMNGGYACYLGQKNFDTILTEVAGLRSVDRAERDHQDIATLNIIDDLPSLDPFLLKIRFEHAARPLPAGVIVLKPDEEKGVKACVARRFSGILRKAFRGQAADDTQVARRILDSLWDPTTEIWTRVLMALGVRDESEHTRILFAIRGVGFYEHLFSETEGVSAAITGYLTEIADRPRDAGKVDPAYVEEVATLRREVLRRFLDHNKQCQTIFHRYDQAVEDFLERNNPATMQRYLTEVNDIFWTLGHYVTALLNCHAILDDCLANIVPVNAIANVETVLRRLRAPLLPRVPTDMRI